MVFTLRRSKGENTKLNVIHITSFKRKKMLKLMASALPLLKRRKPPTWMVSILPLSKRKNLNKNNVCMTEWYSKIVRRQCAWLVQTICNLAGDIRNKITPAMFQIPCRVFKTWKHFNWILWSIRNLIDSDLNYKLRMKLFSLGYLSDLDYKIVIKVLSLVSFNLIHYWKWFLLSIWK